MDIICQGCGEPWDLYYVMHEDRESFKLEMPDGEEEAFEGHLIINICPCCPVSSNDKAHHLSEQELNDIHRLIKLVVDQVNRKKLKDMNFVEKRALYVKFCLQDGLPFEKLLTMFLNPGPDWSETDLTEELKGLGYE